MNRVPAMDSENFRKSYKWLVAATVAFAVVATLVVLELSGWEAVRWVWTVMLILVGARVLKTLNLTEIPESSVKDEEMKKWQTGKQPELQYQYQRLSEEIRAFEGLLWQ